MSDYSGAGVKKERKEMKREVNKIEVKPRVGSNSDSDIVGLVTCHVLMVGSTSQSDYWIADSNTTCHICNNS